MAQKPDGKAARTERVTFTRPAAERIAKVVRHVEGGDRDQPGITYGSAPGGAGGTLIRMAYYTATTQWTKIAFSDTTSQSGNMPIIFAFPIGQTSATAVAVNNFVTLDVQTTVVTNATRSISVMKEGGKWRLIAAEC